MSTSTLSTPTESSAPVVASEETPTGYPGASETTGLPIGTIRALVCRGEIPFYRVGPRTVRFLPSELRSWLQSKRNLPAKAVAK